MTPKERSEIIILQYRDSIISGKKKDLAELITFHIKDAEEKAIEHYKQVQKAHSQALTKAREAKAKKRGRAKGHTI